MNREQDALLGMQGAVAALRAMADGEEGRALAHLNQLSHGAATWAAATLLGTTVEVTRALVGDDGLRRALHEGADGLEAEDIAMTQVALIVQEAEERGDDE